MESCHAKFSHKIPKLALVGRPLRVAGDEARHGHKRRLNPMGSAFIEICGHYHKESFALSLVKKSARRSNSPHPRKGLAEVILAPFPSRFYAKHDIAYFKPYSDRQFLAWRPAAPDKIFHPGLRSI
jgi:hypothetical protein